MDILKRTCKQCRSFTENGNWKDTYSYHQEETVEISGEYSEEAGLGKYDTQRTNWGTVRQRKTRHNIFGECE